MDDELERIKQKRLMEMQRQMLLKQITGQKPKPEPAKEPTNDEILGRHFGDRAWEVWNAARAQYPQVMPQVEKLLVDAINHGKVKDKLDGASLMGFFRQIGIPVHLETRIRISEHGELKTLEQKMKEEG